eukprot:scaffold51032_cov64-Phaeocystis_antarctica.AAC.4
MSRSSTCVAAVVDPIAYQRSRQEIYQRLPTRRQWRVAADEMRRAAHANAGMLCGYYEYSY